MEIIVPKKSQVLIAVRIMNGKLIQFQSESMSFFNGNHVEQKFLHHSQNAVKMITLLRMMF